MEVHRELGMGFKEAIYKDALELELTALGIPLLLLYPDLLSKPLSSFQFQHHKNKFLLSRDSKIIGRCLYIGLFDKPVATGRPDNDLANVSIALNSDLLTIGQDAKRLTFFSFSR